MKYYIYRNDRQEGPYEAQTIINMRLSSDTYVWNETMSDWQPHQYGTRVAVAGSSCPSLSAQLPAAQLPAAQLRATAELRASACLWTSACLCSRSVVKLSVSQYPHGVSDYHNDNVLPAYWYCGYHEIEQSRKPLSFRLLRRGC